MTYVDYRKLFDATSSGLARATVVILIPIAALISLVLNLFGDRRIGVHMVFATHAAAFFLLVPDLLIMDLISPWARRSVWLPTEVNSPLRNNLLLGLVLAVQCAWWYLASRRALGTGRVWAGVQAIVGPPLFFVAALIPQQYIVFKLTMRALAE